MAQVGDLLEALQSLLDLQNLDKLRVESFLDFSISRLPFTGVLSCLMWKGSRTGPLVLLFGRAERSAKHTCWHAIGGKSMNRSAIDAPPVAIASSTLVSAQHCMSLRTRLGVKLKDVTWIDCVLNNAPELAKMSMPTQV